MNLFEHLVRLSLFLGIIDIFLGLIEVSTPKSEGKLYNVRNACCISFASIFGVDTFINPKNITTIPYNFISTLLNAKFDFDVSVANDVAIDVAKCALPGKVMQ